MECPNCKGHIGRFELSPNCKHCGVNIFYSCQEKLLADDAKMCELEYATFRILVAKLKAAFVKGAIPILRIVAMLLAIGAICVPFANVGTDFSVFSAEISFGAIGIYSAFSNGTLEALLNLYTYAPAQVVACFALMVLMVAMLLSGFVIFVALLLSFINLQESAKIMRAFSVVGVILSVASCVLAFIMPDIIGECGFLYAKTGFGSFACTAVFIMIFVLNHLFLKKNISADIKDVDLERIKMRKKVRAGEVSLEALPLPVFESEEEKEKRLKENEERRLLTEMAKGGDANG